MSTWQPRGTTRCPSSADAGTGRLTHVETLTQAGTGIGGLQSVDFVTVAPDGRHVYSASRQRSQVVVFARDPDTGTLSHVESLQDGVNGVDGLDDVYSVAVSPDSRYVYAAGFGDDAVAVFSSDSVTGELSFVEMLRDGQDVDHGLDRPTASRSAATVNRSWC